MRKSKLPLIMRLPRGLREQPSQVFIGTMIFMVGFTFLTGFTESVISRAIGESGLRVWGGILMLTGGTLIWATIAAKPALEKLSLRMMSCALAAYTGYLLTVTTFERAAFTLVMAVILIGIGEIRAWNLTALIRRSETMARQLRNHDE